MKFNIPFPDSFFLSRIKKRHLYFDKKSKEEHTNIIKPKYKLAGNVILDNYFFHVLTTDSSACKRKLTVTIPRCKWENVSDDGFLREDVSYCDLRRCDIIEKNLLLSKIKDKGNTFPYVAKLCEVKYIELCKLQDTLNVLPYISEETKNIVEKCLSDNVDEILSTLELK